MGTPGRRAFARRRMRAQRLWGTGCERPEEVLQVLAAVQSQEFALARWSLAQRTRKAEAAAIDRAFAEGAILRTHVLRPTWHFVLAADIRWMLDLSGPHVQARNAHRYRQLELDGKLLARSNAIVAAALEGGRQLTRKELGAALERAGIAAAGSRLGHLMMHAELDAVVCSGAMRGKQHTYALLDERAPAAPTVDREKALAELARRYFTSRGPATIKDFLWWSGLPAREGRAGLHLVEPELESAVVEDRTYWFAPPAPGAARGRQSADLVQAFDEYIVSYRESRDVLNAEVADAAIPSGRELFMHVVLLDGQLIGRWRPVRTSSSVVVEMSLARSLDRAGSRALDAGVERYGRFLGLPTTRA